MSIPQETLKKWQIISTIFSAITIPIIIAVIGWIAQESISTQSIKKDYVEMATKILKDSDANADQELRKWAVLVIDKNSPVPFTPALRNKLINEGLPMDYLPTKVPSMLMQPCDQYIPLPANSANATLLETTDKNAKSFQECSEHHKALIGLIEWKNRNMFSKRKWNDPRYIIIKKYD